MKTDLLIHNVKIVAEQGMITEGAVAVENGRIAAIFSTEAEAQQANVDAAQVVDGQQQWLLPGFIDIHIHGGFGGDFMSADQQQYLDITRFHAKHGTTTMLATTLTASKEHIYGALKAVQTFKQSGDHRFAEIRGVHLEGPFISPTFPGAQNPKHIAPAQKEWLTQWLHEFPEMIKMITLAPEREGAFDFIAWMAQQGVVVACGHSDASHDEMLRAVDLGLRHAVHTFNAMRGLHHREPGTLGAVMNDSRISAEVIADGHHVHPTGIQLLHKLKGEKLVIITDAVAAAGLGDGEYELGGLEVQVKDGVARLISNGSLAGSTLTMIDALRFMIRQVGVSLPEASRMASLHPAKVIGIDHQTGSIATNKQADLLLINDQFELQQVYKNGKRLTF